MMSLAPTIAPLQWSPSGVPRCTWNSSSGSKTESSLMWTVQFLTCETNEKTSEWASQWWKKKSQTDTQTCIILTLGTKFHLFSFEESDAWLVGIPPLLKVVHHHGRHGPGEAAHWRLERQVTRADDGDVESTVFLLHNVGPFLKLHAGNWERGWQRADYKFKQCNSNISRREKKGFWVAVLKSVVWTYCPGRCLWWQHWLHRAPGGQHPEENWGTPQTIQILRWMGSGCRPWLSNCRSVKKTDRASSIRSAAQSQPNAKAKKSLVWFLSLKRLIISIPNPAAFDLSLFLISL